MEHTYEYREKKIVAVLSNKLPPGVSLNVLGHLALAIGRYAEPGIMGRPRLADGSGIEHLGIARYPFIVTQVKPATVRKAIEQARSNPAIVLADFPQSMLETGHDDELAAAIAAADERSMDYLGAVLYGPAADVDTITGKYSLWR